MDKSFDDIRVKEVDDMTDEDKSVIKEHVVDLTDEEKDAFKDFIPEEELPPKSEEKPEEKSEEKPIEEFKFKTESDFQEAVAANTAKILDEREKAAAEAKLNKPQEERFFEENYQAKDWNEAASKMYPQFKERMEKEQQATQEAQKKRIDEINEQFDKEIDEIAKTDDSVPASGTPERAEYVKELTKVGIEFKGVTDMHQAHKIYTAINATKSTTSPTSKQKDTASKVGRSGGEATVTKERKNSELSSRSLDDMLDEDMTVLGVKR